MSTKIIALLFSLVAITPAFAGPESFWRPEKISAKILRDDKYLRIGQYLFLSQKLTLKESGWVEIKLDIPESWHVTSLSWQTGSLKLKTKNHGAYMLSGNNVPQLDFEILKNGASNDAELSKIWEKYALTKG